MGRDVQIIPLNLLRTYAVEWDEETLVRDLWQNFYDATEDFAGVEFHEDAAARTVRIHGPVRFDVDHVKYIGGTTKSGGGYAGQFGEGFKICALVAIRDFKLGFRAGAGKWRIEAAFEKRAVGEELVYRYWEDEEYDGSFVELVGCSEKLRTALQRGRRFFRWKGSASLSTCLFEDGTAFVYKCTRPKGEIYYCKQLRAETSASVPLAICFDREIVGIRRDRDRRNLTRPQIHKVACAVAARIPTDTAMAIVHAMKSAWAVGSPVLEGFVAGMVERRRMESPKPWPVTFPPMWAAREEYRFFLYANDDVTRMGYTLASSILAWIGMPRALDIARSKTTFVEESDLSPLDRARRALLVEAGRLGRDRVPPPIRFARMENTAGLHTPEEIRLEHKLLGGSFAEAVSTYVHELCHEAGPDGSSAFSDALTDAIGQLVANARRIDELRACWDALAKLDPAVLEEMVRRGEGAWLVPELVGTTKARPA